MQVVLTWSDDGKSFRVNNLTDNFHLFTSGEFKSTDEARWSLGVLLEEKGWSIANTSVEFLTQPDYDPDADLLPDTSDKPVDKSNQAVAIQSAENLRENEEKQAKKALKGQSGKPKSEPEPPAPQSIDTYKESNKEGQHEVVKNQIHSDAVKEDPDGKNYKVPVPEWNKNTPNNQPESDKKK